jgi:hypothetical protein
LEKISLKVKEKVLIYFFLKIQIPTLLKKEQSLAVALKKIQKGAKEKLASLKFKEYNYTPTSKNLEFLSLSHSCNFSFKKFYSSSFSYSTQMKTMLTQNHKISIFKEQQDIAYARTDLRYIWWANVSKKTK